LNEGIIHFSKPETWRDKNVCSGKQLDVEDGCFCKTNENLDNLFKQVGREFFKTNILGINNYYEKSDFLIGTCFYGIQKSKFKKSYVEYGVKKVESLDYVIPHDYFKTFVDDYNENYSTIIIYDLPRFFSLVRQKLIHMGAKNEEILIYPVYYVNKKYNYQINDGFPFEYFLKDDEFSIQSEIRIIVNCKSKKFFDRLKRRQFNISVGDISSFACVQSEYEKDLNFSIQDDKLLFNLAKPISRELYDCCVSDLAAALYQALDNELPGPPKNEAEIKELVDSLIDVLNVRYNVNLGEDKKLYNVPFKEFRMMPINLKKKCATLVLEDGRIGFLKINSNE